MRPMRHVLPNGLTLGILMVIALASGAMTLVQSNLSHDWEDRIALAQSSYAEHLSLQANVTALFKEHGDALLFGDRDGGTRETELAQVLQANIARIRAIIAAEIEMVGGEEAEELEDLARIEDKVRSQTGTLRSLSADGRLPLPEDRRAQIITLIDDEIDVRLAASIAAALDGERAEVDKRNRCQIMADVSHEMRTLLTLNTGAADVRLVRGGMCGRLPGCLRTFWYDRARDSCGRVTGPEGAALMRRGGM